ncbi:MAG: DUF11 domain-containing protein [Verrucomicrobia bacterium]|nr:DUF11 domain-containing protein [Verrucomicrobiota bacterium]
MSLPNSNFTTDRRPPLFASTRPTYSASGWSQTLVTSWLFAVLICVAALPAFAAPPQGIIPTISITDARVLEGNSGFTPMIFTISLSQRPSNFVLVDYATQDGLAIAGQDYVQVSRTQLIFDPAGPLSKTIVVQIIGDTVPESDEDFIVSLFNAKFATIGKGVGTGTILNDDTAAYLTIDNVGKPEGNSGTNNFVFTVSLLGNTKNFVTVQYYTVGMTATGGNSPGPGIDFLQRTNALANTLVFTPSQTNKTITIPVLGDPTFEPDEQFAVVLTNASQALILTNGVGFGTIQNDDASTLPVIFINDVSLSEGNAGTTPANFTVSLSSPSAQLITVNYSTTNGTATAGSDYSAASGVVIFNPGETVKFIPVNVFGDTQVESDETFTVNLTTAVNATIARRVGTGTILNDDSTATALLISVNDAQLVEGDSGTTNMVFSVVLSAPLTNGFIVVNYTTSDGTATAGVDYVGATNGSAIFFPNSTTIPIRIPVLGDLFIEPDETFFVTLSSVTNFQGATVTLVRTNAQGTILNDDTPPLLSVSDAVPVKEGNSGTTNAVFTVSLSHPSPLPVTVDFLTQEGTAAADVDYVSTNGSLAFAPFETSKTFSVTINGDTLYEADEFFLVILGNAVGADINIDGQGHGIIVNDDPKPALSIADVSAPEGDTGTKPMTFTVSLSAPSGLPVSLDYFTADGSAFTGRDYFATNGTLTLVPGLLDAEISVPIIGNTTTESDKFFFLKLTNIVGTTAPPKNFATGTIQNDDAVPQLSVNDPVVLEGNSGTSLITFNITLSVPTAVPLQIPYFTSDGTATAGSDYLGTNGVLNIPSNVTSTNIDITVLGDLLPEPDETFTLTFLNAPNVALQKATGTATIVNDDIPVFIAITDSFATEGSAGTTTPMEFTLTLSTNATSPITVAYSTADGAAKAGIDYVATNGVVLFGPGVTTQTITVNVIGNDIPDGDRFLLVNLANAVNAVIGDDQAGGFIIDDDFLPALRINDAAVTEGDTGTTNMIFTVTLSTSSGSTVSVDYATADDTAKAGSDYVGKSGKIIFSPGALTQTISIPVIGDLLSEPTETFFVNLANPVNAVIVDNQAIGTITDNDSLPLLNISDVTVAEGDTGTTNAVFTVTLASTSGQDVTVKYATSDGTATAGSDYVAASGTITIRAGTTSQTISVAVNGDRLNEPDETFFVNLSSPVGARIGDAQGAGTIRNDDAPPQMTIADATVHEGNSGITNMLFAVQLSAPSAQAISASFATADAVAVAGKDYLSTNGVIRLNPGQTNLFIAVGVIGNVLKELDRNFFVNLTAVTNASLAVAQANGLILDDDAPPLIFISDVTVNEGNSGTTPAVFNVFLSEPSGQTVSVDYATADGTANAGSDYLPANNTLIFDPGITNLTITVLVNGDVFNEPDETFFVNLLNPTHAALQNAFGKGTIKNDDSLPTISAVDIALPEGDTGTTPAVVQVRLSGPSAQVISVAYTTSDVTATSGVDYQPVAGTLTFTIGETNKPITVLINGDTLNEPDETFVLKFSAVTNANLPTPQTTITIRNDDPLPTIQINDVAVNEGNSGTVAAVFAVNLSQPSSQTITVDYTTADGTAKAGSDYQAVNGTLTFTSGVTRQFITVLVNGDTVDEPNETFNVNLSNPKNALLQSATARGTILNDDAPPVIFVNSVSVVEGNGGAVSANFTATLSNPSQKTVTVDFATADGTATSGSDYVATTGSLVFLPGQTNQPIRVSILGDALNEPNEQFFVNLANPTNAVLGSPSQGTGTINDDDPLPSLLITDAVVAEGNSGFSDLSFRFRLSTPSGQTVKVDFATADGTATAGSDYLGTNGTVIFPPGVTVQTVSVAVIGDLIVEPDETLFLNLSNPVNAVLVNRRATGTIRNDEQLPTLTITDASVIEGNRGATNAVFNVLLSQASSQTVSVDYATVDGTAGGGSDYAPLAGTLTFAPGVVKTSLSIAVFGDTVNEPDESFFVALKNPVNATIERPQGQGTILNDDAGNSPPFGVAITSPANRSTFPPNADIAIKATASDSDGTISRVEFYAGSTLIGSATTSPYGFVWANVPVGDYSLTAKAIDDQGAATISAPVAIAVTEITGSVAIVQNAPDPEIGKMQDYLFEMGVTSQVLDHQSLTFETLQQFQLIIWDDTANRANGLSEADVELFRRVFTNGVPLYFIGNQLASATANLSASSRALWTGLVHLRAATTQTSAGSVNLVNTERDGPLLSRRFGTVADFAYAPAVDVTTVADSDSQVIGTAGASDVLVAFPPPSLGETGGTRSFTQNVHVLTGADDTSIESRKVLFQNVVCWLIRCGGCGAIDLLLEGDAASSTVPTGSQLTYNLVVRHSGECEGIGVVLTDQLPPGVDFVSAESTQGTWQYAEGVVRFYIGHVMSASVTDLHIIVTPTQPGAITNIAVVHTSGPEVSLLNDTVNIVTTVTGSARPVVGIALSLDGRPEIRLQSLPGRDYTIETSSNLINWLAWTNLIGDGTLLRFLDTPNASAPFRFYRVRDNSPP